EVEDVGWVPAVLDGRSERAVTEVQHHQAAFSRRPPQARQGTLNNPSIHSYGGLPKLMVRSKGACATTMTQIYLP
ncbi:MAG: hypothetical protein WAT32_00490, partial [Candidatus Microthrix parvicella]